MTATLTPRPPATRRAERGGFLRTLHAEWTKFRTVRGWVLAMAGALLVTIVVGLLGTAAPAPGGSGAGSASYPEGPGGEAVNDSFYFVRKTLTGDGTLTVPLRTRPDAGNSRQIVCPCGPLDLEGALDIRSEVLSTLEYAHSVS
ncbi:hypothetical protein AB0P17_28630 [Streptomyces sp. NPDC088124]|uniref:hypothetical protein n=1 Tax=Streptomyces sp. NPDC088124 TaxID=3154654 RepID=UPI0034221E26